jgi:hypothetical protein
MDTSMPRLRTLTLPETDRQTLVEARAHHPAPAVRERAAALLKIADGRRPHWVAHHGLLQPRDPDTIYGWLERYQRYGLAGILGFRHGGPRRREPL